VRLICGFLNFDGRPAEERRLDAMVSAMIQPGLRPRIAKWVDGPIALAMLDFAAKTDERKPATGLPQGPSGLILAADIRLDAPYGHTDDSGLLDLLELGETNNLDRLSGDFAFAAWDPRRRTLLLARDGMGVRPLFLARRPGSVFVFASLPRGLHASGLISKKLEQSFIVNELLLRSNQPQHSLFSGVERLIPGDWLRVAQDGKSQQGQHWRLNPRSAGRAGISAEDAATELSALVSAAVSRRLPATGPVASHLSGGMDSCALAILATRALRPLGRNVQAYSLLPTPFNGHIFGGEGQFIAPVLRQEPDIMWFPMQAEDPLACVLPRMDEDQLFPSDPGHPEVRIMADASVRGAQTLFSGWGGDEGASYNHRGVLAEALLAGHWGYLTKELRVLATERQKSMARTAWSEIAPYLWSGRLHARVGRLAGREALPPFPKLAAGLLQPHIVSEYNLSVPALQPDARRIRFNLLTRPGLLRRIEQWSLLGARYGMSTAFPLLDRRVVEFALSLPSELFLREGWPRRVFRDAMSGVLPNELRWKRSKLDLIGVMPLYVASQRPLLLQRLAEWRDFRQISEFFDLDAIEARLRSLPPGADLARLLDVGVGKYADFSQAHTLLRTLQFIAFLEQHG
jgi:asparagine synthase (glutamine-hydrolysing)